MRFSLITELPNYKEEPYINIPLIYDTVWRLKSLEDNILSFHISDVRGFFVLKVVLF